MAARPSPAPADEAHPLHYAPPHRTDHSALSPQLIDGKAVAATGHERVRVAVATRLAPGHRAPALATVLVGDRKRPRLNSSPYCAARIPSSAAIQKGHDAPDFPED